MCTYHREKELVCPTTMVLVEGMGGDGKGRR